MNNDIRYNKVLGLNEFQPKTKYVCFLPFHGEFGWMIQTFVKRVHGYNHSNKIVCTKPGHECLFPSAQHFYHDWKDVEDNTKAGILANIDEEITKLKIIEHYQTDDIHFLSASEVSWEEKVSLSHHTFIPKSIHNNNLNIDIVICPRNRQMDAFRNWKQENWQTVINILVKHNITIGVCGAKETSFQLENVKYKSYDYMDVDSDVEMMSNCKLVVAQESGLAYLSYLCKRPTYIIDHYHNTADIHRDHSVYFAAVQGFWNDPPGLAEAILSFL